MGPAFVFWCKLKCWFQQKTFPGKNHNPGCVQDSLCSSGVSLNCCCLKDKAVNLEPKLLIYLFLDGLKIDDCLLFKCICNSIVNMFNDQMCKGNIFLGIWNNSEINATMCGLFLLVCSFWLYLVISMDPVKTSAPFTGCYCGENINVKIDRNSHLDRPYFVCIVGWTKKLHNFARTKSMCFG